MDLKQLRKEIDGIDDQLVQLFAQRMAVSARIADYKKEHDLPIFVPSREQEKLLDVAQKAGSDLQVYTKVLYDLLFELSRGYQSKRNAARTPLFNRISQAIAETEKCLPKGIAVACPGEEDPHSAAICQKLFGASSMLPFKHQDGILSAVSQGLCRYGLLPLDGNCKELYDMIGQKQLFIVRALRLNDQRQYICVSKRLEIFPGTDRTSLRLALSDRPGALYKVLARLYTLGINVARLESKPLLGANFTGMFYFDLETSVYSEEFVLLMCELEDLCTEFTYLGSYCEVV